MSTELDNLEAPEPAEAAKGPLGAALLSVVVGSVLLLVSLFATWVRVGPGGFTGRTSVATPTSCWRPALSA